MVSPKEHMSEGFRKPQCSRMRNPIPSPTTTMNAPSKRDWTGVLLLREDMKDLSFAAAIPPKPRIRSCQEVTNQWGIY